MKPGVCLPRALAVRTQVKINAFLGGCRLSQSCVMTFDQVTQVLSCSAKPRHIRRFTFELRYQLALAIYTALLLSNEPS